MMQRSDLLLLAGGLLGACGAYVFFDWLGAAIVLAALGCGVLVGLVVRRVAHPALVPPPQVTKVAPGKARAAAQGAAPSRTTRLIPLRQPASVARNRAASGPAMEPAAAFVDSHAASLRMTGDILRGMQTGGKVTRGLCSQCGSTLWLSARRPVKARCPSCGFSRILN